MSQRLIESFFRLNDEFLKIQFEHACGNTVAEAISASHLNLISFTRALSFEDENLRSAKEGWLEIFESLSVHFGFPQFKALPSKADISEYLRNERNQLVSTMFTDVLQEFISDSMDPMGLGLDVAPAEWLKKKDLAFDSCLDPNEFKNALFASAELDMSNAEYKFVHSTHGGFFMIALNSFRTFYIGHGPLNSLFRLSTLAHELGHSTTARSESLLDLFLSYPETVKKEGLANNEDDSYLYERLFATRANEIMGRCEKKFSIDVSELLFKRKAIQYNQHLLANLLNWMFFVGRPIDEISAQFANLMKMIYPKFEPQDQFAWVEYATLHLPLSKVGFLKAYLKHFKYDNCRG